MTNLQVVQTLIAQGHRIRYSRRSDGGILVKEIDGLRFPSGAKGNQVARQMAGVGFSEAREKQLKYATRTRERYRTHPKSINSVDKEIKERFKEVKKIWGKRFKATKGKPHQAGYFGWSRIQYTIEKYGKAEALRRIEEAERYALGYAYSKNVKYLIIQIRDAGNKYQSNELLNLADDVEANMYQIKEDWIYPAYDELYKLNSGASPKDVAENVRKILRL